MMIEPAVRLNSSKISCLMMFRKRNHYYYSINSWQAVILKIFEGIISLSCKYGTNVNSPVM